ncbi:MAG: AzlD domain-containing protein [Deltaproteobacteria bacterium]|nr:AzlD domain-containing protein [Deltaproteobacteria bacterium]
MTNFLIVLIFASLGTQFLRLFFLGGKNPPPTPSALKPAMEFVPVSILSALVFTEFFASDTSLTPRLITAFVAILLSLGLGRDLITILGGLFVYWLSTTLL